MFFAKRMTALALGAVLVLSLGGCTGSGGGATTSTPAPVAPAPADAVKAASEKMGAAKSMQAVMVMEMDMVAGEQQITSTTTTDMTTFADPVKMRAEMKMDMGELGAMSIAVYAQADGENYTLYVNNGSYWQSQAVTKADLGQYSAMTSMDMYLDSAADFVADGTEDLTGGTANKYTGVIRGEALQEVLESSGAMDSVKSQLAGSAPSALDDLYSDLGDLPVTIWIDQASGYPARYTMDMTETMGKVMDKVVAALGDQVQGQLSIPKMTITLECSNFDAAEDFDIPAEALAA